MSKNLFFDTCALDLDFLEAAIRQWAVVELTQLFEHRFLAVGGVDGLLVRLLELADFDDDVGALVQQDDDLLVERVDLPAEIVERPVVGRCGHRPNFVTLPAKCVKRRRYFT